MRSSLSVVLLSLGVMCSSARASLPWFSGYVDPNNSYRYFAHSDWDSPLFGVGINPDTSVFGVPAPAHRVDGHVTYEADGTGSCRVIESTGSFAFAAGYSVGSIHSIPSLFADPYFNPGFTPVSDTRGDYNADFVNVVSGPIPEPSVALMVSGGIVLLARRRAQT